MDHFTKGLPRSLVAFFAAVWWALVWWGAWLLITNPPPIYSMPLWVVLFIFTVWAAVTDTWAAIRFKGEE